MYAFSFSFWIFLSKILGSIHNGAFAGSGSLTSIVVSSDNAIFDSRENCNAIIETASNTLICGCVNTTIPSSVTMIGDFAFFEIRLTTLTIPISIISIGNSAFSYCENLRWVIIPNSVTSIGEYAFTGCSGLTSISVSSGNPVYDSRENCNAIIETASNTIIFGCVTTTIPNSVTSIGDYAFSYYSDLTTLTIPNSVTSIGNYAFYNCSGMTSLTLPNSVTSIGDYAFSFCSGLTTLTIPNSVISIGEWAFSFCSGLTTLTIGNSLTSISKAAFYYCRNLTTLSIGNSVTTIGNFAFEECNSLSSLTIPSSVTAIGSYAFKGGSNLTEINCLGATAPELWGYSFYNVDNTIPVNIPCGSLASYQPEWSYSFSNFNEILSTYTLDVYSSDDAMGSASITTLPNCDDNTAVIEATANDGYHFDHWSDGSTANPYTVQLTDNTTLIAYFSSNTGIEDIDNSGILVYAKNHQIHIDAAIGETVSVYTIDGRTLAALPKATEHVTIPVTVAGVYLVKIGNYPARKVVVTW